MISLDIFKSTICDGDEQMIEIKRKTPNIRVDG
jgi:hypothetical protein